MTSTQPSDDKQPLWHIVQCSCGQLCAVYRYTTRPSTEVILDMLRGLKQFGALEPDLTQGQCSYFNIHALPQKEQKAELRLS